MYNSDIPSPSAQPLRRRFPCLSIPLRETELGGRVTWAVSIDGRIDREAVLFLVEERDYAESIAIEMRRRGQRVVVHLHMPGTER